ncbi:Aminoglycoside 3'-phosphotransferase [compost metagenome]
MITRCVPGEAIQTHCDDADAMLALFREALRQLQAVPIINCPFDSSVSVRLDELEYLIERDLCAGDVDLEQWPTLCAPRKFLTHLYATRPVEDRAFSHGDLCDTNVFLDASDQLYFIDLGRGGIADRYLDIAFAHRNLREDVSDSAARNFLCRLGEPDQPEKRLFYEQLDELF